MLTAEQFFEAFGRAGLLDECTWVPANGQPSQTAKVDFRASGLDLLGDSVSATDYEMTCPFSQFPNLSEGDQVTIKGVTYRVREVRPASDADVKLAKLGIYS
jgi:hypothetical protein